MINLRKFAITNNLCIKNDGCCVNCKGYTDSFIICDYCIFMESNVRKQDEAICINRIQMKRNNELKQIRYDYSY